MATGGGPARSPPGARVAQRGAGRPWPCLCASPPASGGPPPSSHWLLPLTRALPTLSVNEQMYMLFSKVFNLKAVCSCTFSRPVCPFACASIPHGWGVPWAGGGGAPVPKSCCSWPRHGPRRLRLRPACEDRTPRAGGRSGGGSTSRSGSCVSAWASETACAALPKPLCVSTRSLSACLSRGARAGTTLSASGRSARGDSLLGRRPL